ncbi:DUF1295 domain-containing protein [Micromonospora sp. NBC_01638]|uniref:DUF1295 domain-containing protein n=1 Tax=Micromonospora sp. NBC_01638 TaxID=2975982 RepID=UPI003864C43E|nr:DUF1295 domain-containing protein [Micromonospora sp. NBC_01638]
MKSLQIGDLAVNLAVSALAIACLMACCLVLSLWRRDWSLIDVVWGTGFVVVAAVSVGLSGSAGDPTRRWLMLAVTSVWGLRLAAHLFLRSRGHGEDPRYTALMRRREGALIPYVVRTIFWPQGRVMWFVSIPIQLAMYQGSGMNIVGWCGVVLAVFGIVFESVGDLQLTRFKGDPDNAGRVMDRGLWSWTRHPNYFGDSCVMFGLWAIACGHWIGVLAVVCPAYMTHRLINRNGKALLERRMARRRGEEYAAYVARTSGFFPLPPRRRPADQQIARQER